MKALCMVLALAVAASAQETKKGGTVTGTVVSKTVAKFETLVYIEEMPDQKFEAPKDAIRIDQVNKEFKPHVVPMLVGSTVEFQNSDAFEHNVNSPDNEKFNLGNWGLNDKRQYTFSKPGVYTLLCSLHPEMVGYAVVLKTPYFVMADKDGNFTMKDIPAGKWKLKVWNERLKPKQLEAAFEVTVEEGKEAKIELKP